MAAVQYGLMVIAAYAIGCSHEQQRAPAVAVTPARMTPVAPRNESAACLADEIGTLNLSMSGRPDCTETNLACRARCLDGDAAACMTRAHAIERNPRTTSEAAMLFEKACQLGNALGCTNYGATLWSASSSTPQDLSCARRIFEKTCGAKEDFACGMVGRMLYEEANSADDYARARAYLERSCDAVKGFPCRVLAKYLEDGKLGSYEPGRIAELLARACEGGDPDGCGAPATANETFN